MNSKIKILVAALFLVIVASATETTWRHSGFEVASFDMNFSSTFNITELRVLEWGWNTSTPSVSGSNRAIMYYDNNQKQIMQSIDGRGYEKIITNLSIDSLNTTNANQDTNLTNFQGYTNASFLTITTANAMNVSAASNDSASRINDTTHDLKFNNVNTSINNVVANNTAQATYDNTTFLKIVTANAMNVSNAYNQSWAQSLFDWLNITTLPLKADGVFLNNSLAQQATNNTAMNVSSAANRTYAQQQSDNLNNSKLNKSGDTMTGTLVSSWINDTSGNAYLKNITILNTSTVTVTRHSNGSVELVTVSTSTVKTLINITQNYTIGAANTTGTLYTCHANSGTQNITLPTGVNGTEFSIKKKDATSNVCSVFSGQNIDGARYANISTQYESIDVVYTSDEWSII